MDIILRIIRKIQYSYNRLCRFDYKPTSGGWKKSGVLVSEDSCFDPSLVFISDRINIFYSDRNHNSICRVIFGSNESAKTILLPIKNTWEDKVNRCSVLFHNGIYYLYYTGQFLGRSCIGVAVSNDGVIFSRIRNDPLIEPTLCFEKNSVMNPTVLFDEAKGVFKMWYSCGGFYEPDHIAYAESSDGIIWKKLKKPVLSKKLYKYMSYKVGGCEVHLVCNRYIMYFIGYQNIDVARVCKATSHDGINWQISSINPLISPSKNEWDSDSCYKPSCVFDQKNNMSYLFYNGRQKNHESIGFATKYGNDLTEPN